MNYDQSSPSPSLLRGRECGGPGLLRPGPPLNPIRSTRRGKTNSKKLALRNSYLAYNLACLGIEKNGHVTYRLDASKSVGSFSRALMHWRREKGKPVARRGRKA